MIKASGIAKGQYPVLHPKYDGLHYNEKMSVDQLKQLKKYLVAVNKTYNFGEEM